MNHAAARSELESLARQRGAVALGIARLADVRTDDALLPTPVLRRLKTAASVALPLLPAVLDGLADGPDRLYEHHYRQVNFALDRLALDLAGLVERLGGLGLPIPASQIVDWENQRGHLSHKRVAVAAGVGWLGRNNLLVTPEHGAQVRLVTVLTDLDLPPNHPLENGCGDCRACITACPAGAIREEPGQFDHLACYEQLREFRRQGRVSQFICGLCVRACGPRPS